jgi:hypothetical protein
MLHPELDTAAVRDAFARTGSIRIERFLDDSVLAALRDEVRVAPHTIQVGDRIDFGYQYWVYGYVPDAGCDHVMCRFGRWLFGEGAAWLGEVVGFPLVAPDDRQVIATHYDKGSFLDPHNDYNGARKVAFVLGLTAEEWPYEDGGWLEFLASEESAVHVAERRPPGWNTLDLFDVRAPVRSHAIGILRRRAERRAISGWLY